jgi:H+-translocating diphosphatase
MAVLGTVAVEVFIPVAALIGIAFAVLQWYVVARVAVNSDAGGGAGGKGRGGGSDVLEEDEEEEYGVDRLAVEARCAEIQQAISIGATSFLLTEYKYLAVFMAAFAAVIFLFLGSARRFSARPEPCAYDPARECRPALANAAFSAVAFLLGALTSVLSGYLGMRVATFANARTALEARRGVDCAFAVAFRSGAAMGFLLASSALLVLYVAVNLFGLYYGDDWGGLYESITGYGLGGSSVALFGRVGGGIYTKAADVGADLVGKVERNIPEDDPRNPAVRTSLSRSPHARSKLMSCTYLKALPSPLSLVFPLVEIRRKIQCTHTIYTTHTEVHTIE